MAMFNRKQDKDDQKKKRQLAVMKERVMRQRQELIEKLKNDDGEETIQMARAVLTLMEKNA